MMNDENRQRLSEVKDILAVLKKLEEIGDDKEKRTELTNFFMDLELDNDSYRKFLNIFKANMVMMVYNLVEATISSLIQEVYDQINDLNLNYGELSEELKDCWLDVKFEEAFDKEAKFSTYKNKAKDIVDKISKDCSVKMSFEKIPGFFGNIDSKVVRNICKIHGIHFETTSRAKIDNGMLNNVKRLRNDLAHGNVAFSDCGKEVSTADYEGYIHEIEIYLSDFEDAVYEYIKRELYSKR